MTDKELIKWAKQNLQEVQKLKEKTDQEKEIQECGFFSNSKSSSYEKIEKKLQKNLVDWKSRCNFAACLTLNNKKRRK